MSGYTAIADGETGASVRGKINTQNSELFAETAKASITVADEAARLAIPSEYLCAGKIAYQVDTDTNWVYDLDTTTWNLWEPTNNKYFGEMYAYENASQTLIDIVNVYHAIAPLTVGPILYGFTYKAGAVVAVASVASASGGTKITCTSNGHALADGDIITIVNSTNYDGAYVVEGVTLNTFTIAKAYVVSRSFSARRGASLTADSHTSGVFELTWNMSGIPTANNKVMKVEPNINLVAQDRGASVSLFTSSSDYSQLVGGCLLSLVPGDKVWMSIKNKTDSTDFTVYTANVRICKL
jgi:hypothetical protein